MSIQYDENKVPFIDLGKYKIRWENEDPDEEAMEKARRELRESPEIVSKGVEELRALIKCKSTANSSPKTHKTKSNVCQH